mmetsp:Transcript_24717/g.38074  ORF Transcript_24717/g.38074 Transcript_24717/m.38074 type:complete len:424 (-) Transcript_24717:75-1346(-)|eukprot:CAMPEP_0195286818 /NCGR_PEP_ID=MMETSP0707-20130614/4133_1 /TAXON_ID=33640 /ORGANISM="Asterionellopsis glacialis, Strain CCMP134" /LENGTH=423 /DNA_ID=CAMNT_0040346509 /DNA_START=116 /DNA_END=1387 /DNA_ORIENTATION=+
MAFSMQMLEEDNREAVFKFHAPVGDGSYGFFAPEPMLWIVALTLIMLNVLLSTMLSVVVKTFIIDARGKSNKVSPYLIGYGIIIPLVFIYPYYFVSIFDVRNKLIKFLCGAIVPTVVSFRVSEAIHGCEAPHTSKSAGAYALYFGSILEICYDRKKEQFVKSSTAHILDSLKNFAILLCMTGALYSLIDPYNLEPFLDSHKDEEWYSLKRLNLMQLGNNLVHALLFQLYLTVFCEGLAIATSLIVGYKTKQVMHNPVLSATSPSEFWGRKWNTVVHGALKGGVFKPAVRYFGRSVAVFSTFLASGLLHEWILTVVFRPHPHELTGDNNDFCGPPNCFTPVLWSSTAFFLWNALMLAGEASLGHWKIFQWIKCTLPQPIVTALLIMLALPIAHWFCDPYIRSDMFFDGQLAFPMIRPIIPSFAI